MLWRDGHSDVERVRAPIPWLGWLPPAGAELEAARAGRGVSDFGDNKSRLTFLQTAEFAAIFDPH
jgi:hypothetical protein